MQEYTEEYLESHWRKLHGKIDKDDYDRYFEILELLLIGELSPDILKHLHEEVTRIERKCQAPVLGCYCCNYLFERRESIQRCSHHRKRVRNPPVRSCRLQKD